MLLSAALRPSHYLFKTPGLCFSLTLPVYIGYTPHRHTHTHTNTLHHYRGMHAVWLAVFHFDEWLYYLTDNICKVFFFFFVNLL